MRIKRMSLSQGTGRSWASREVFASCPNPSSSRLLPVSPCSPAALGMTAAPPSCWLGSLLQVLLGCCTLAASRVARLWDLLSRSQSSCSLLQVPSLFPLESRCLLSPQSSAGSLWYFGTGTQSLSFLHLPHLCQVAEGVLGCSLCGFSIFLPVRSAMPFSVYSSRGTVIPSGVEEGEAVWSLVSPFSSHTSGTNYSTSRRKQKLRQASSKHTRNRQKNKGLREQVGRSYTGATTSVNKQVKSWTTGAGNAVMIPTCRKLEWWENSRKRGRVGVGSEAATGHKSGFSQQRACFVLCLCAADTTVMFISIEGVQILALGWLRNDSVAAGTKSSCGGSRPHLTGVSLLSPTTPGFWKDTFGKSQIDLGVCA